MSEKEREVPIVECRIIETEDGFIIEAKGEWAVKLREALAKGGLAAKVVACC